MKLKMYLRTILSMRGLKTYKYERVVKRDGGQD